MSRMKRKFIGCEVSKTGLGQNDAHNYFTANGRIRIRGWELTCHGAMLDNRGVINAHTVQFADISLSDTIEDDEGILDYWMAGEIGMFNSSQSDIVGGPSTHQGEMKRYLGIAESEALGLVLDDEERIYLNVRAAVENGGTSYCAIGGVIFYEELS